MKKLLIDRLAAWLLGPSAWGEVQGVVHILQSTTLTGTEKRHQALEMFEEMGLALAGFLLNLGLELAVAKLKL